MNLQPTGSIKMTRRFLEPPPALWQAWIDPKLVQLWFGSDPKGTVLWVQLDVRAGGKFEVIFANADGTAYTCFGSYKEVELNRRLTFTWSWKNTPDIEELVDVRLQEDGLGTLMTFVHANIDPNTSHGYEIGWSTTFDKLEKALKHLRTSE